MSVTFYKSVTDTTMDRDLIKCLDEVDYPDTITAERALQMLSYPCFSPAAYSIGDEQPIWIFLRYMRLIRLRLPDACVDGIWEDILRKTAMYVQHFSTFQGDLSVSEWLDEALSSPHKCPNPYFRLELFRLMRMLQNWGNFDWCFITDTFIHTVSEIKPSHLYSSGNKDEVLFSVIDLKYIMNLCFKYGGLKQIISRDILRLFRKSLCFIGDHIVNYQIIGFDSKEIRFILHVVQLIGMFADMTGSITNPKQQIYTLMVCCTLFRDTICGIVDSIVTFRVVVEKLQIREYIAETMRKLASAVTNLKKYRTLTTNIFLSIRDEIIELLGYSRGYCSEPCELPRLILNRQIHGSTIFVQQHSLFLGELEPIFNVKDNSVEYNDDSSKDELSLFNYIQIPYNDNSRE